MRANFQGSYSPIPPKQYAAPTVRQDRACYRVLGKGCFLDGIYFFEGDLVYWEEEPNKDMEPMNDLARKATNAFFDKIEKCGREASALKGTKYIPLRRPIEEDRELNSADARRVEIVEGDGGVPVYAHKGKKGRPRKVEKIVAPAFEEAPIADMTGRRTKTADA